MTSPVSVNGVSCTPTMRSNFAKLRDGLPLTAEQLRWLVIKGLAVQEGKRVVCEPGALKAFNAEQGIIAPPRRQVPTRPVTLAEAWK